MAISAGSNRGAGWLFAPSGVAKDLGRVQRGPLYIDGAYEVTATGYYNPTFDDPTRVTTPLPLITMVTNPSGTYRVSASGVDGFTLTFANSPVPNPDVTTPTLVGHWFVAI